MHTHSTTPHDQAQEMANLEEIWSGLFLGCFNDETVSYVCIPVHPRGAMAWNEVTQTPSLPMRFEPPPQPIPYHMPQTHVQVCRSVHPYQAPVRHLRAQAVRQRNTKASSSSMDSPKQLLEDIFRFLDLREINIALREEEPNLYIIMFLNPSLPFVMFVMH